MIKDRAKEEYEKDM